MICIHFYCEVTYADDPNFLYYPWPRLLDFWILCCGFSIIDLSMILLEVKPVQDPEVLNAYKKRSTQKICIMLVSLTSYAITDQFSSNRNAFLCCITGNSFFWHRPVLLEDTIVSVTEVRDRVLNIGLLLQTETLSSLNANMTWYFEYFYFSLSIRNLLFYCLHNYWKGRCKIIW